jgi:hypothetical protein
MAPGTELETRGDEIADELILQKSMWSMPDNLQEQDEAKPHYDVDDDGGKVRLEPEPFDENDRTDATTLMPGHEDEFPFEASDKNVDEDVEDMSVGCTSQLTCHPLCTPIRDAYGCEVECHCDDDWDGSLTLEQQQLEQQQQQQPLLEAAEREVVDVCSESDVCQPMCDVESGREVEQWNVDGSGCRTCVCVAAVDATTSGSRDATSSLTPKSTTLTILTETVHDVISSTTATTAERTTSTSLNEEIASPTTSGSVCPNPPDETCRRKLQCRDAGYAKDENGCELCACAPTAALKLESFDRRVDDVVADARKVSCAQSIRRGPCHADLTRWFYDVTTGSCATFSYGGCRGNANNFRSESACRRYCVPEINAERRESRLWYRRILGMLLFR